MYLENGVIDSGEFTISTKFTPINAINSDKRNDSIDSSIPIYNNKYYMGIITNDEAENYYKIKFKKETKFSLKIISKEQSTIDITISDADGNTVYNDWCYYNTKSFSFNDYLPAGEYNIIIKKSQSSFNDYRRYEMVTGSYVAFKSITIPSSRTMKTGDTYIFKAKTKPADATGDYIFISSNDKVVKVHKTTGKITAVGSGTATITVMTTDGDLNDKCKITVKKTPQVSKITLKETKATLFVGESKNMSVKISPKDATNVTVKWKSSNKKVATVSASGKVTAKASGSCKITATAGGKSVTANITVKKKPTKSKTTQKATPTPKPTTIPVKTEVISISMQSTLRVGIDESKALTVTIIPGNAHDMSLTWSSTDASVASVEDGTIKGKKAGKTTIIASASNGKKAYCTVLVGD